MSDFDLKRIVTATSPVGRVHICHSGGDRTLCGKAARWEWGENLADHQPTCALCIQYALRHGPVQYPLLPDGEAIALRKRGSGRA